MLQQSKQGLH